jgi:peptide/nickel transport system substrate-binding protein
MRTDKEPFSDLRVRQALFLAINWQSMNESLYGGKGQIITFPYVHVKGYDDIYMDYNAPDIPANVKDLFSYHPDKAKQLLSEAGYPNGFKATVLTASNDLNVDYYSIIKEFWSKINVDLNISTMESTALFSLVLTRNYDSMITDGQSPPSTYPEQYQYTGDSWVNQSYIKDNKVTADANIARDLYLAGDTAGAMKATRELLPYVINQCWVLGPLRFPAYVFWWPWVKNYDGETCVGYVSNYNFPTWIWVDQNLKQSMGH